MRKMIAALLRMKTDHVADEPAKTEPHPAPPAKPDGVDDEFERGAKLTRAAGLWMLGALSATGIGIFGAQPAVRGQAFSWTDETDRYQLTAAAILGSIGIIAISNLIYRIARLQAAVRYTLTTLPVQRQAWLVENRGTELPSDAASVTAFQANLNVVRVKIAEYEQEILILRREIKSERGRAARKLLVSDLAQFEAALRDLNQRLATYLTWKAKIVSEAQESTLNEQLLGRSGARWLVPALIATIGIAGLLFTLALAKPTKAETPAASPVLGTLHPGSDSQASQNLWATLGLASCEVRGEVPVFILEEASNVTSVRTIALNEGCQEVSFSVIAESAVVSKEVIPKVTIDYKPTKPAPIQSRD